MDNQWFFTSDLHLSHGSILNGYRGQIFKDVPEHNKVITDNLLALPRGSNLIIAGDIFWKFTSQQAKEWFDQFQKRKINIHIIYGNHDKMSWFNHKAIKSQGHRREFSVNKQSITVAHYNECVWNKSHYNSWLLFGHTHMNDSTYERAKTLSPNDTYHTGKKLNVNVDFNYFKPWSFDDIKAYMDKRPDNWDFITKEQKEREKK